MLTTCHTTYPVVFTSEHATVYLLAVNFMLFFLTWHSICFMIPERLVCAEVFWTAQASPDLQICFAQL